MRHPYSSYPRMAHMRYPARRPVRAAISPWLLFGSLTALIALILLPIFFIGGLYAFYTVTGRIFPGVQAASLPAGNLTHAQLAQKLDAEWNQKPRIAVTDGSRTWPVKPVDLGIWVNPQATASRAYEIGRGPDGVAEILWLTRFGSKPVEPVVVFHEPTARAGLERLAAQVNVPAQNAVLRFENGNWTAVPGQNGTALDIETTLQRLAANPQGVLAGGSLPVATQVVMPRIADLTPVLERLQASLNNPLILQAYDPITDERIEWSVPRETFASWVTVEEQDGEYRFGLDAQRLKAYLQDWQNSQGGERSVEDFTPPEDLTARWQEGRPVTFTLRHNPTTYTVQAGETLTQIAWNVGMPYWMIQQANPGIDPDRLQAGQVLTIPSKNELLPLPVVPNKRIVISISEQHMWTYENGSLRSEHVISTGIDRSPTIPGVFQVRTHELEAYASVWDLYMPHFMGIYEGWPGFMNGIHGLPTLSSGRRLWAGNLGRPVSYGCIILDLDEAEDLYHWAEEGVIVEIKP